MNLREAAGQALEALEVWRDCLTDPRAIPGWRFAVVGEKAMENLRAALAEDVPETNFGNITQTFDSKESDQGDGMNLKEAAQQALEYLEQHAIISGVPIRDALRAALEPVTTCHELSKEGDKLSLPFNHFPDAGKMVATSRESRQVEPVAWMRGDRGHVDFHRHPDYLPLYTTTPPKRKPLTDEEISKIFIYCGRDKETFARAIEQAHGIGGDE